jgi:hypothetical protein
MRKYAIVETCACVMRDLGRYQQARHGHSGRKNKDKNMGVPLNRHTPLRVGCSVHSPPRTAPFGTCRDAGYPLHPLTHTRADASRRPQGFTLYGLRVNCPCILRYGWSNVLLLYANRIYGNPGICRSHTGCYPHSGAYPLCCSNSSG